MATTKGELTREAILDAAIVRFGRDGFRATSVADIARDADVGGTVAYTYFPSKEALFLAALDEDAAAVIQEGLQSVVDDADADDWRLTLFFTLIEAVDRHPLARRVLAGLEPEVTDRVLELPALDELRTACANLIASGQQDGTVRPDIDPVSMGNGVVSIMLSLLTSVVQVGRPAALAYGADVAAVFQAALHTGASPGADARVLRKRLQTSL
ncbi:MAG: TetR/AcrR family transcriptional regulator [Microthrixaceae bacterium]